MELLNGQNLAGYEFRGGKENRLWYKRAHCWTEYANKWREQRWGRKKTQIITITKAQ